MSHPSDPSTVEVFRLRVARGNQSGNGSSGDWSLYEDRAEFERETLRALIEADAHGTNRRSEGNSASRWWHQHILRRGEQVETREWTVSKVFAAEQLIGGEWVDLCAELIPPRVVFSTTETEGAEG